MNRVDIFGNHPDFVSELIRTGRYDLIPKSRMSKRFEDENPWPPPQFTDIDADTKLCTWCGHHVDRWVDDPLAPGQTMEKIHACERYGKHCRHRDLVNPFYMRTWSYGRTGRHHYDPEKIQALMVKNLTSGVLQLAAPKTYVPQRITYSPFSAQHTDYDKDEYECECVCDTCYDEDEDVDTGKHCGNVEIGCDQPETWEPPKVRVYNGIDIDSGMAVEIDPRTGYAHYINDERKLLPQFMFGSDVKREGLIARGFHALADRIMK